MKIGAPASAIRMIIAAFLFGRVSADRQVILSQEAYHGSCVGECSDMPVLHNEHGCKTLKNCQYNSLGWTWGVVRCDWCQCTCEEEETREDDLERFKFVETGLVSTDEIELFNTCQDDCHQSGLVQTNFKGWQEVSNCRKESGGWLNGFVYCDYCTCEGKNVKYPKKYTLKDIRYNFHHLTAYTLGTEPASLSATTVDNCASTEQQVRVSLGFTETTTKTIQTSSSLSESLSLEVTATKNFGVDGFVSGSISASLKTSIQKGWTTTEGSAESESRTDHATQVVNVPAGMKQEARLSLTRQKLDVPYTATLVSTYEDGSEREEPTEGVLSEVRVSSWDFDFSPTVPIAEAGYVDQNGHVCTGSTSDHEEPTTSTAEPTPTEIQAPTTGTSSDPLVVAHAGEDSNLDATGAWKIFPAEPILDSSNVPQVFNTIVVESDWHSKRPSELVLHAYGAPVCVWQHPFGYHVSSNCNEGVFDFLQNGANKKCELGYGSFSMCKLPDMYMLSEIEHLDLDIVSSGGSFAGDSDSVIRGGVWFVLMD